MQLHTFMLGSDVARPALLLISRPPFRAGGAWGNTRQRWYRAYRVGWYHMHNAWSTLLKEGNSQAWPESPPTRRSARQMYGLHLFPHVAHALPW